MKLSIDARYFNSIIDITNFSWPPEPINVLMRRINRTIVTSIDLSSTCNQTLLTEDTQTFTSFIVGDRQFSHQVEFFDLKPSPNVCNSLSSALITS